MTPESLERAIQFILEQQARFDAMLAESMKELKLTANHLQETQKQVQATQIQVQATQVQVQATQVQVHETQKQLQETDRQLQQNSRHMREQSDKTDKQILGLFQSITELKNACRDLLDHARFTDKRLERLEDLEG